MSDEVEDALIQIGGMLGDIEQQLRNISTTLDSMRASTMKQIELMQAAQVALARGARAKNAGVKYESGHGPRRDGDTYGIVARQPVTETSPEPPVHADHPTGHLRSSDEC